MSDDLREFARATRSQLHSTAGLLKATRRAVGTAMGMVAELEERLSALENAQPEEAKRNDQHENETARRLAAA